MLNRMLLHGFSLAVAATILNIMLYILKYGTETETKLNKTVWAEAGLV